MSAPSASPSATVARPSATTAAPQVMAMTAAPAKASALSDSRPPHWAPRCKVLAASAGVTVSTTTIQTAWALRRKPCCAPVAVLARTSFSKALRAGKTRAKATARAMTKLNRPLGSGASTTEAPARSATKTSRLEIGAGGVRQRRPEARRDG